MVASRQRGGGSSPGSAINPIAVILIGMLIKKELEIEKYALPEAILALDES